MVENGSTLDQFWVQPEYFVQAYSSLVIVPNSLTCFWLFSFTQLLSCVYSPNIREAPVTADESLSHFSLEPE